MVKLKTGENVSYKCLKEAFDTYLNMPDIPNGTSVQTIHKW